MPELLKLLIRFENPAIISTKSDLILRDYDLIDQLSRVAYVNIAATVTTMDEDIRSVLEPGGVSSSRRFDVLSEFRKTNASSGCSYDACHSIHYKRQGESGGCIF